MTALDIPDLDIPTVEDFLQPEQPVPGAGNQEPEIQQQQPPPQQQEQPKADLNQWKPDPVKLDFLNEPPKQPESKQPEAPAPKQPEGEPEPKGSGVAQLRQAYEEVKKKASDHELKVAEYEALNRQHQAELEQLKAQLEQAQAKLSVGDPWQHPSIREIVDPVNQEIQNLPNRLKMSKAEQKNYTPGNISQLTAEFRGIGDPSSDGYDERRQDFQYKISEMFPESGTAIRDVIARSADALERAESKLAEVQRNGTLQSFEEVKRAHEANIARYKEQVENAAFQVSQEMLEAQPWHTKSVIARIVASSESAQATAEKIKEVLRKAAIPPAPISPEELNSLPPDKRDALIQKRQEEHQGYLVQMMKMQPEMLFAYQHFGIIFQKWQEAEERLKQIAGEVPAPSSNGTQKQEPVTDLKSWAPPPIPKF